MFSRRFFVASGTSAVLTLPVIRASVTSAQGESTGGSEIQSTAVDAGRTRVVPGDGLLHHPGEFVLAAEDVSFAWSTESAPSMMLTSGVVLAHGADDSTKSLIAFDAASGEELWRDVDVNGRLGAVNGMVMYDVRPADEAMPMHMKVVDARSGEALWQHTSSTSPSGVFPNASSVLYTHLPDMSPELVCRNLESGEVSWQLDISDVAEWTGTLPTADENVVIAPNDSKRPYTGLTAWSVESGEMLWHVERESGIAIPTIANGLAWTVYPDGVESLDVQTGDVVERFDMPMVEPGVGQNLLSICLLEDQLVAVGKGHISAVAISTGQLPRETERAVEGHQSQVQVVNDMVVTIEPSENDPFDAIPVLRGYSLADGSVTFEWKPPDEDAALQAFMIADDHLYVSTSSGFYTFMPGNEPFIPATFEE